MAPTATVGEMYRPRHFAEDRVDVLVALARAAGFGHLVVASTDGLMSTPVPFVVDDEGSQVRAHLARPNELWRLAPCDGLLVVPVTDAYVTPSWYPGKAEHGKVVPTWNYEVVHLHGRLEARDDPEWIGRQIRDLTDRNESTMPSPWSVDDAPADFVDQTVRGIVGVELSVTRVEGKRKLSQNRSDPDRRAVIDGLETSDGAGAQRVADAMRTTDDRTRTY